MKHSKEKQRSRPKRVALIGSRGIPASYSGFETFYEQLAVRLVQRGYQVTCYNRSGHFDKKWREYKGVHIVTLPSIPSKHLDTLSHSFLSLLHAIFSGNDYVMMVIVGNSPLVYLAHLFGKKIILNVDGADFARDKWTGFAKTYLRWAEKIAARSADVVIADSQVISRRYMELFQRKTVYIPYGANLSPREQACPKCGVLDRFSLDSGQYILFVSRMTPENCAHVLIEAFLQSGSQLKLVLVGDAPYVDDYKARVRELTCGHENILLTGYLFAEDYRQISANCRYFVLPSGIDGTRPVLLDQMAFGNCVVVRDTPANLEVIDDAGLTFNSADDVNSLAQLIRHLENDDALVASCRDQALSRVSSTYSWETVVDQYEKLFKQLDGIES